MRQILLVYLLAASFSRIAQPYRIESHSFAFCTRVLGLLTACAKSSDTMQAREFYDLLWEDIKTQTQKVCTHSIYLLALAMHFTRYLHYLLLFLRVHGIFLASSIALPYITRLLHALLSCRRHHLDSCTPSFHAATSIVTLPYLFSSPSIRHCSPHKWPRWAMCAIWKRFATH